MLRFIVYILILIFVLDTTLDLIGLLLFYKYIVICYYVNKGINV